MDDIVAPPRGAPRRRSYAKSASRRAQIVDAATNVFAQSGYKGGSLREIAAQLDVGLTSLVHHFPTKIMLLESVLDRADAIYLEDFDDNCREFGMRYGVLRLVEINFGHPELLRLFATLGGECSSPEHPGHQWFLDRYQRVRAEYAERFSFDQRMGRLPQSADAARVAERLIAEWDGLQLQWLIDPSRDMVAAMNSFFDEIGATSGRVQQSGGSV